MSGTAPASAFQAAASPARSLSVKDSATISAGVWPRSTGSARSSSDAEVVARRCIGQPARIVSMAPRSMPLRPITTSRLRRSSRGGPGAVVIMVDARADGLQQQPHRLAADLDEAFHAQHVFLLGRRLHAPRQLGRIADRRDLDDEDCRTRHARGRARRHDGSCGRRSRPRRQDRAQAGSTDRSCRWSTARS